MLFFKLKEHKKIPRFVFLCQSIALKIYLIYTMLYNNISNELQNQSWTVSLFSHLKSIYFRLFVWCFRRRSATRSLWRSWIRWPLSTWRTWSRCSNSGSSSRTRDCASSKSCCWASSSTSTSPPITSEHLASSHLHIHAWVEAGGRFVVICIEKHRSAVIETSMQSAGMSHPAAVIVC